MLLRAAAGGLFCIFLIPMVGPFSVVFVQTMGFSMFSGIIKHALLKLSLERDP